MLDVVEQIRRQIEFEDDLVELDRAEALEDLHAFEDYMARKYSGAKIENILYHRVLKVMDEHVGDLDYESHEILQLKYWEDKTNAQIAKELKLDRNEVIVRLEDALESLRISICNSLTELYGLTESEVLCAVYGRH